MDDLTELVDINDKTIIKELSSRYKVGKIYTNVADVLVSFNPNEDLPIYGAQTGSQYSSAQDLRTLPPHVYAVTERVYREMGKTGISQSVLMFGDSGSGKSECTKIMLSQLARLCEPTSPQAEEISRNLLQVTTILEAFGHAFTITNHNASRLVRYLDMMFDETGSLQGVTNAVYLLEVSRVTNRHWGEKNFHVFYDLMAGLHPEQLHLYGLQRPQHYRYLAYGEDGIVFVNEDAFMKSRDSFLELQNALDALGFRVHDQESIFKIIAALLHLGNIQFDWDSHKADVIIVNDNLIYIVADLLSVSPTDLFAVLKFRGATSRVRTKDDAARLRDNLCESLYEQMFEKILETINNALGPPYLKETEDYIHIRILDPPGFQDDGNRNNNFDQLCKNIVNEKLTNIFNQTVFKEEKDDYIAEGLKLPKTKLPDNNGIFNFLLQDPWTHHRDGLGLAEKVETIMEPNAFLQNVGRLHDSTITAKPFIQEMGKRYHKSGYFKKQESGSVCFSILHTDGEIHYDACKFVEKFQQMNLSNIEAILRSSRDPFIQSLSNNRNDFFGALEQSDTGYSDRQSTTESLKNCLQTITEEVSQQNLHFIRCFRPNGKSMSRYFDNDQVHQQMTRHSLTETVKIRTFGFPVRLSFQDVVDKFAVTAYPTVEKPPCTAGVCERIMKASKLQKYYIGKSKVFLKYWHLKMLLGSIAKVSTAAVRIQSCVRTFLARRHFKKIQEHTEKRRKPTTLQDVLDIVLKHSDPAKIWCKILYVSYNKPVAAFSISNDHVIINSSCGEFDGQRIGLGYLQTEGPGGDQYIDRTLYYLGNGLRLEIDADGNIWGIALDNDSIVVPGALDPANNSVSPELVTLQGRLPRNRPIKVFDMNEYRCHIALAMKAKTYDKILLQRRCVVNISIDGDARLDERTPCWLCAVNYDALRSLDSPEVIKDVRNTIERLSSGDVEAGQDVDIKMVANRHSREGWSKLVSRKSSDKEVSPRKTRIEMRKAGINIKGGYSWETSSLSEGPGRVQLRDIKDLDDDLDSVFQYSYGDAGNRSFDRGSFDSDYLEPSINSASRHWAKVSLAIKAENKSK